MSILVSENQSKTEQLKTVWRLSVPAILAQISSIIMQYIDAAMVGNLGAEASAAIGVVASSTWLLGGMCGAASAGFSVQVAHFIGAGNERKAREVLKTALTAAFLFSLVLLGIGTAISGSLPQWLGADQAVWKDASVYFLIYALSLPAMQLNELAASMLQCSGNMRTPSILNALMCGLDVVFNAILIGKYGVAGAALGTALAQVVIGAVMLWMACVHSPVLGIWKKKVAVFNMEITKKAVRIAVPMAVEHIAICGAMVAATRIVAPLGMVAIAANSFAVTAESLCYMPGYGIAAAATTLVGQSMGAGNRQGAKSMAKISVIFGMLMMAASGALMFLICPLVFKILTPDAGIRELGVNILRIELFAEPLFGASIVASGALRGAGDTLIPSVLNLVSIWGVRITLSMILVGPLGLNGVWIAMCIELCVRGLLMIGRLRFGNWMNSYNGKNRKSENDFQIT